MEPVRVAVFGLGYVGVVSAACLADRGHEVIGVDVSDEKVAAVNAGTATIVEELIGDLVASTVASGRLRATTSAAEAVGATDLCFVCVGTPSAPTGALSTDYLERVAEHIGAALPTDRHYTVIIRSTILPGTIERVVRPAIEKASGRSEGDGWSLGVHPEFLREGTSVRDFREPVKTVVGGSDAVAKQVFDLYDGLPGEFFAVPIQVAEMIKYADNSFHALKVAWSNEIGALAKAAGIDSHELMDVFKADTKLNVSTAYLTPGFAFGGSCLPKDVRGIVHYARHADVNVPLLSNVLPSNDAHLERAFDLVAATGSRKVGIFGLAFKSGTDDLRESPMVRLAERLHGRGYDLLIHDTDVMTSRLIGANRAYVEAHLPHLSRLMRGSVEDVLAHAEVCLVGKRDDAVTKAIAATPGDRIVIDVTRLPELETLEGLDYRGLCW